jgi:DNA polymerase III delta subunit
MILLLSGADALAIRRRLQELRDEADGGTGMLATNLVLVPGWEAKPHDIIGPALSLPFLAAKRLVIVEGLLDRFEQRPDQRAPRSVEPFAPLFQILETEGGLPESTMLVFTGGALKRNPIRDRLKKIRGVADEEHKELKGDSLLRFIREEASARGIKFRSGPFRPKSGGGELPEDPEIRRLSDPASVMALLLLSDTLSIVSELDKLALYTMGRDATVSEVYESCAGERESNIWALTDGVMDGDLGKALTALDRLRRDGEEDLGLMALMLEGYRRTAKVIDLLEAGRAEEEIMSELRLQSWTREREMRRARVLGRDGLMAAYKALVGADRGTKLGEIEGELAIEVLIAQLVALARPATAARR